MTKDDEMNNNDEDTKTKKSIKRQKAVDFVRAKYPNGIYDLFLLYLRKQLQKISHMKNVADHMDHYSRFIRRSPDELAHAHRWTEGDIGKTLSGYEDPEGRGSGIQFVVTVVDVFGPSAISFEVREACDLSWNGYGHSSKKDLGPFADETIFYIDGGNPINEDFADRACAAVHNDEMHQAFRLHTAIQNWALQPRYDFLQ